MKDLKIFVIAMSLLASLSWYIVGIWYGRLYPTTMIARDEQFWFLFGWMIFGVLIQITCFILTIFIRDD